MQERRKRTNDGKVERVQNMNQASHAKIQTGERTNTVSTQSNEEKLKNKRDDTKEKR